VRASRRIGQSSAASRGRRRCLVHVSHGTGLRTACCILGSSDDTVFDGVPAIVDLHKSRHVWKVGKQAKCNLDDSSQKVSVERGCVAEKAP
jgi:hypothetical protein